MSRVSLAFSLACALLATPAHGSALHYPPTEVHAVRDTLHGEVIEDPYRWLEDRHSRETGEWIARQAAFTDSVLTTLPGRDAIRSRIEQLLKVDTQSVPEVRNDRYFFSRRGADQDLPVLYVRRGLNGADEVLLDPQTLSRDHSVTAGYFAYSSDGKRVAIARRTGGEDEVVLGFMDVDSRRELPDRLPRARYFSTLGFTDDGRGVYYSRFEPEGPRVYFHVFGTDAAADSEVFGNGYRRDTIINLSVSDNGRWLLLIAGVGSTSEHTRVFVKDLHAGGPITPIVSDLDAASFPEIVGDRLLMRTDWQAPNDRLLSIDLEHPERERWKEIVPEGQQVMRDFAVAGGELFVEYLENVVAKVRIFDLDGKPLGQIAVPGNGSLAELSGRPESREMFFSYASFTTPTAIYRYDVGAGKLSVWWRSSVAFASNAYELEQVWYASRDGTKIPMFLAHRKGLKLDGSNPVYLTGYGGFDLPVLPQFTPGTALFLERGGVWASANLRGGSEFGEAWHRAGMLDHKQNVFDDFIAAAEWLIANKYTSRERLAIGGNSNGGLLVAAAMTQRPDLFRAVLCGVPLIDMLRYHNFLVARLWVPEYGSAENPDQFRFLRAYSPYQHVTPGTSYPAVLFVSGDSDTRVDPLHARKMAARMQAATGSDRPILLHYHTKVGHVGAAKSKTAQIEDDTDRNLFLFWQLKMLGGERGPGRQVGAAGAAGGGR